VRRRGAQGRQLKGKNDSGVVRHKCLPAARLKRSTNWVKTRLRQKKTEGSQGPNQPGKVNGCLGSGVANSRHMLKNGEI